LRLILEYSKTNLELNIERMKKENISGFVGYPLEKDEDLETYQFPDPGETIRYESLQKLVEIYKEDFFIQGEATLTFLNKLGR